MTRIELFGHMLIFSKQTYRWKGSDEAAVLQANSSDLLVAPGPGHFDAVAESIERLQEAFPGQVKVLSVDEPEEEPDIEGAVF